MKKSVIVFGLVFGVSSFAGESTQRQFLSVENKYYKCMEQVKFLGLSEADAVSFVQKSFFQMRDVYTAKAGLTEESIQIVGHALDACENRVESFNDKSEEYSGKALARSVAFANADTRVKYFYQPAYPCYGGTLRVRAGFVVALNGGVSGLRCIGTNGKTRVYVGPSVGVPTYPSVGVMASVDPVDNTLTNEDDLNDDRPLLKFYTTTDGNDSYDVSAWAFVYGQTEATKGGTSATGVGAGVYFSTGSEMALNLLFRFPKVQLKKNWNVLRYLIAHGDLPVDRRDITEVDSVFR